jgi:cytochrome b561
MPLRNSPESYGSLAKLLHWSIVILIIAQYFLAESAHDLPDGVEKLSIISNHKSLGMLVLILAVVRIGWRVVNGRNPAPVPMPGWQTKVAAAGHGLLYLLLLAQPISGWMMSSAANYPVTLFGLFQFPAIVGPDHEAHETLEDVHEFIFELLLVVAVLHALAALYHHFFLKDDSLRRMLPFGGRKG